MTRKLLLTFALIEVRPNLLLQVAQKTEEQGQLEVAVLSNLAAESIKDISFWKVVSTVLIITLQQNFTH